MKLKTGRNKNLTLIDLLCIPINNALVLSPFLLTPLPHFYSVLFLSQRG